jgi:hypothetical protein
VSTLLLPLRFGWAASRASKYQLETSEVQTFFTIFRIPEETVARSESRPSEPGYTFAQRRRGLGWDRRSGLEQTLGNLVPAQTLADLGLPTAPAAETNGHPGGNVP